MKMSILEATPAQRTRFPQTVLLPLHLLVNEKFAFSTEVLLKAGRKRAATKIHLPVDALIECSQRYKGDFELLFLLTSPGLSSKCLPFSNVFAYAIFPCGSRHYLGPVAENEAGYMSGRLVTFMPSYFHIVVQMDDCLPSTVQPPWPCEMLLKEHIKTILENDEFCGSIASSHVQNLVRELPFYADAMRRLKWSELVGFFVHYYHTWSFVTYGTDQHQHLNLSCLTAVKEIRLVANRFRHSCACGDAARDHVRLRALIEYRAHVAPAAVSHAEEAGAGVPFSLSKEKIQRLSTTKSLLTLNCINYFQVVKQTSKTHWVLFSPRHPVRVDRIVSGTPCSEALCFSSKKVARSSPTEHC